MTTTTVRNGNSTASGELQFLQEVRPSLYTILARGGPEFASPLVSVVVPTRNRSSLVADAIAGVLRQDLPEEYELIVVDNASEDDTAAMLVEQARESRIPFTAVRLDRDRGPAVARNVGVTLARGRLVAFTDSDCVPAAGWLRACSAASSSGVGVVQGMTLAHPGQPQPLFNHFIETRQLDGSFSTSNVCYRRDTLLAAGGFDPGCLYWEDVDLGWRVRRLGWDARFEPLALVYHQVLRLSAWQWVTQPRRFYNWPAKAARYPEFRRHLWLGLWAHWWHLLFESFLAGLLLARWRRRFLALTLPYLVTFPLRRRFTGRWPLLKAAAHFAYDCVTFGALLAGSIRFRRPVL